LTIENCTISGFDRSGIEVDLSTTGRLYVTDTNITRVTRGVRVNTTSGQAWAALDNVRIENVSGAGVVAANNSFVTIFRSLIAGGDGAASGVLANTATSRANVLASSVGFFYGTAINASAAGAVIRLSDSDILNNVTAIAIAPGAIVESDGKNRVAAFNFNTPPNAAVVPQ